RNRYYISMSCIIVVNLYPPFYPPFCFKGEMNLLRVHAPAHRCHVVGWQYGYLFIRIVDFKKVSTTTSIMKDIFKRDRLTNENAVPLSLSDSKSALHRFM
ncbi:hypothetical protein N8390_10270, partial [Amylibacter sp.]|nr:hypothetical protein [Amylibacter sp.]